MAEIPLHDGLKYECPWLISTAMLYEMSTSTYLAYFLFPKIRVSFHTSCKLAGARALIQSSTFKSVKTVSPSFPCAFWRGLSVRGDKSGKFLEKYTNPKVPVTTQCCSFSTSAIRVQEPFTTTSQRHLQLVPGDGGGGFYTHKFVLALKKNS